MDEITYGTHPEPSAEPDLTYGHPGTLAVASLVLSVLSLLGAGVFRGAAYTLPLADFAGVSGAGQSKGYLVAGLLLSAAFALLPLLMARKGLSTWVADDGAWAGHLLRAAVLLSIVSLLLHLVVAVLYALADNPGISYGI